MPTTLIICEKLYLMTAQEEQVMKFIEEAKAIQ
jgi:hypothetical protein